MAKKDLPTEKTSSEATGIIAFFIGLLNSVKKFFKKQWNNRKEIWGKIYNWLKAKSWSAIFAIAGIILLVTVINLPVIVSCVIILFTFSIKWITENLGDTVMWFVELIGKLRLALGINKLGTQIFMVFAGVSLLIVAIAILFAAGRHYGFIQASDIVAIRTWIGL